MSLIGPRPLLPRDQPPDPAIRLSVRPGITGWAQVNGGHSLCVEEKDALDEWYIRNASLQLDLRIIFMTLACVFRGERRSDAAIAAAFAMRRRQCVVPPFEMLVTRAIATSKVGASEWLPNYSTKRLINPAALEFENANGKNRTAAPGYSSQL
jgi:hypothetical protein